MDGGDPMARALLTAFNALIGVAPPERVVPVLRGAVLMLLREETAPMRRVEHCELAPALALKAGSGRKAGSGSATRRASARSGRSRRRSIGNLEIWLPIRDRVRAGIAARGIEREAAAAELGLAGHTLKIMLGKRPRVPGPATIERVRAWLAAQGETEPASPSPGGRDLVATAGMSDKAAKAAEAAVGRPAHKKLSAEQRERLAAWRELENAQALRAGIGVAVEVVDEAIAGKSLEPEIVSKLTQFLSTPLPTRC